jgi:glycosyltransferase involved in cell wall biosynthesis
MAPSFAVCFRGRLASELAAQGVPLGDLGRVRASRPWTVLRARARLAALVRAASPDVVVCHMPWAYALFGSVARRLGRPVALWLHGPWQPRNWPERAARRHRPSIVIANSQFTAGSARTSFAGVATEVVHCPVALAPAAPAARRRIRAELATRDDDVVIAHVARMDPFKGHALLLDAVARLRALPGWVLWEVGGAQRPSEARYLDGIRARARALGVADRVRFAGGRTDIAAVLAGADICCQPNVGPEPFGISVVEAMLAGLPVVATDLGAMREIVDERCAILVRPDDPGGLSEALRALVDDPARRARLGAAAPAHARRVADVAAQVRRLHDVLHAGAARGRVLECHDA